MPLIGVHYLPKFGDRLGTHSQKAITKVTEPSINKKIKCLSCFKVVFVQINHLNVDKPRLLTSIFIMIIRMILSTTAPFTTIGTQMVLILYVDLYYILVT